MIYSYKKAVQIGKCFQQVEMVDFQSQEEVKHLNIRFWCGIDHSFLYNIQIDFLTTEVSLCLPRITALEYCKLDLSLIPKVIVNVTHLCKYSYNSLRPFDSFLADWHNIDISSYPVPISIGRIKTAKLKPNLSLYLYYLSVLTNGLNIFVCLVYRLSFILLSLV